jgi:hypothetical protein
VNLSTCILTADGRPERRVGGPDTRLMRYERRGDRTWFVTDDEAHQNHLTAYELPHDDLDDLGEWLWYSTAALRWPETSTETKTTKALAHRLAFLQRTA